MNWIRSSKGVILAALLAASLVAVGTAAAVDYSGEVPEQAQVGETVEMTVTIEDPFTGDRPDQWTLAAQTELDNASWTVQQVRQGETIDTTEDSGDSVTVPLDNADGADEVTIQVRGTVAELNTFDYENRAAENYTVVDVGSEIDGDFNSLHTWDAHRYTTQEDSEVTSLEARQAIDDAIDSASESNDNVQSAISSYNNGNFENAVNLANDAESSANTSQLLLMGAGVLVLLALVGGGYYYWKSRQDTGYKLQ